MTVQLTWDTDAPKTGLPDQGSDTKTYPSAQVGHVEVTPEPVGSGPVVEADFTVPLITTPDATTIEPGGTLTIEGSGLAPSSSGTLALIAGPPGTTGGATLVSVPVTADATGAIPSTSLSVPADAAEGEYHLVLSGGAVIVDNVSVTVGGVTPTEPAITATPTTVDSTGDETARTVTVEGESFPAELAGRVSIMTGAPGSGGTEVVGTDVTTDTTGNIPATPLIVPENQAAGDYHIHAEYTGVTVDDIALTVTKTPVPELTADKTTVDSTGDETERTVTIDGTDLPATTAGRVSLLPGAPGSGGTEITGVDVTSDATGAFTGAVLVVPADQAAGDYHITGDFGAATIDDLALEITATPPPEPEVTPDATTIEAGATLTVDGTGFPATTAGRVSLFDDTDTEIVGADVTTDAAGEFTGAALVVHAGQPAGDLALRATVDTATSPDVTITVTLAPPAPPANVTLDNIGPASVQVNWDEVTGADGYVIYYRPSDEAGWMYAGEVAAPTTDATVTALTSETSYDFAVATLVGTTMGEKSPEETASTIAGGAPLAQAVATSPSTTATSVELAWDSVTDAQSYEIRWRPSDDTDWSSPSGTEDGASTGTSMEGLTPATEYDFGVRAIGDGTTNTSGPWSADVTASTLAALAAKKRASRKKSSS